MVLIDWKPEKAYFDLLPDKAERDRFFKEVCTFEWHCNHDAGVSFADNAKPLLEKYKNDQHMQRCILAYGERFQNMLSPIVDSVAVLRELCANGISAYALTNWSAESFPETRQTYDFFSLFKDIIVSGVEREVKPNPRIYQILLERTGIDPKQSVFTDDRAENLVPANKLGFSTIHFTSPENLRDELIKLGLPLMKRCA